MKNHADHRIPGYSDEDMAALAVLVRCQVETNKALQDLAHLIAAERGYHLKPQPAAQPKVKPKWRLESIDRHPSGKTVAVAADDNSGRRKRITATPDDDGAFDVVTDEL